MQLFRGLEHWGRERVLGAFVRAIPTLEISAQQAGETLRLNPEARILLIGIYQHMGQFLCTTPMIRSFKEVWPRGSLQFLGNPVNAASAKANPHLDRVWVWKKSAFWEWFGQIQALRKEHFDLVLVLTTDRPSATGVFLARAMGARWVAGYVPSVPGAWAQDIAALSHIRIPLTDEKNEVEKFLGIARALGIPPKGRQPEMIPSPEDEKAADAFLTRQTFIGTGPRIGLFVGGKASRSDRLWPIAHFARLADLLKEAGFRVIVLSPPPPVTTSSNTFLSEEHLRLEEFRKQLTWNCPVFQEASVGRVAAFLRRLDLLVCPDGGILHLAASVGTPTLGLFFSTDPEVWQHDLCQTYLDGRGKPSSEMAPETVAHEAIRFLGASAHSPSTRSS